MSSILETVIICCDESYYWLFDGCTNTLQRCAQLGSVFILWTKRAIGLDPYANIGRKRAFIAELIISSIKSADQTKQFDWFAFRASKHEYHNYCQLASILLKTAQFCM
jgi:hypothetical protein